MSVTEQRTALIKEAEALAAKGEDMTREDMDRAIELKAELKALDSQIRLDLAESTRDLVESIGKKTDKTLSANAEGLASRLIAQVKGAGGLEAIQAGMTISTEFKTGEIVRDETELENYNMHTLGSIMPYVRPTTVTDLFAQATTTQEGIEFLRWTFEGEPEAIEDGALKPQMTGSYKRETANLREIAAHIIVSEALLEDESALEAKIRDQLVRRLAVVEENQIVNGDGTSPNLAGLLSTAGIGTATTTAADLADDLLKAVGTISDATGMRADAIAINPADWHALRISKDENGQYILGGPSYGPYGNGAVDLDPALWGLRVLPSPVLAQGTVVVGAFREGGTVYRKGTARLAASDSHADTFVHDLVTIRIRERLTLVVDYPEAFVNLTIEGGSGN